MKRLVCPFCGPRELEEFAFRKTVAKTGADAFAELYERIDQVDSSLEHWQHVHGCRAWLLVHRNPTTGAVLDVKRLGGAS